MLASEVQKILDAGHLRAGYLPVGLFENFSNDGYGEYLTDYFHHPSEILYVLSLAYPHLSTQQQDLVKTYLQSEYTNYAPYSYTHIGFKQGTSREAFQLPDDIEADRVQNGPDKSSFHSFSGWSFPPQMFYHLWKYALITNNAKSLFDQNRSRLDTTPPDNTYFGNYPYILNAWIAGYRGYLELEKLAGYTTSISTSIRFAEYNRLLNLRKSNFTKDVPSGQNGDFWALNSARNFMWLVPELADELNSNSTLSTNVAEAFNEYNYVSPYWFVSKFEAMYYEGNTRHLFDPWALFQTKAQFFKNSREELVKYLDVPAFERGDLFYIQNLVAAIEAPSDGSPTPTTGPTVTTGPTSTPTRTPTPTPVPPSPTPVHCTPLGDLNCSGRVDIFDLTILLGNFSSISYVTGDLNNNGRVDIFDLTILLGNFGG